MTISRALRSIKIGAARTMRIRYRRRSAYVPRWSSDYAAVANDWATVGVDLAHVLARFRDEQRESNYGSEEAEENPKLVAR